MSLLDVPEKIFPPNLSSTRTDFGQISAIPVETAHDCSIKLVSFKFDDPYEADFEPLAQELSAYLSRGWLIWSISAAMAKDNLDARRWGTAMIVLRRLKNPQLWQVIPQQAYQVKILPIVSQDPYADTLEQGEIWLDYYLKNNWRILDVSLLAGGDEISCQRWAISLFFLGCDGNSDFIPPAIEWCDIHLDGEQCKQDPQCLWCNY